MSKCGCWFLLLGPDEGDRAVGLQRPGPLPGPAVEHGQRGQRWRHAAASRHVPQLVGVPEDGVVVVQLDPAAGGQTGSCVYTQKCLDRLFKGARCRNWRFKLRVSRVYSHQSTYWFVLAFLFSLQKEKKEEQCVTSGSIITFRLKGQKEMCVFNKQHCGSLLSFTYTPSRLQNMT